MVGWVICATAWPFFAIRLMERLIVLIPRQARRPLTIIMATFMAIDIAMTLAGFDFWFQRLSGAPVDTPIAQFFNQWFGNDWMSSRFGALSMWTDLATGRTEVLFRLPRSEFGEGIALVGGELFQLTWQSNTAHVYDPEKRTGLRDHRYAGEGWGLTTDGEKLYMTDGTANLYTIDPATFRRERRTTVTLRGEPVELLNELEWIDGRIWANVYTTDQIVIIDPATGRVEGIVDLRGLLPDEDRTPGTDVLNGIAYDAATGRIFLTGKNWSKLFEIELVRQ